KWGFGVYGAKSYRSETPFGVPPSGMRSGNPGGEAGPRTTPPSAHAFAAQSISFQRKRRPPPATLHPKFEPKPSDDSHLEVQFQPRTATANASDLHSHS
ncbi:hypothetical protein, partial [Paraburkholderia saeva]|uniref:hypothetical protein n=1 Tax=Paraburkholderia saeva TaxID=2777537 RepID=UPI001E365159